MGSDAVLNPRHSLRDNGIAPVPVPTIAPGFRCIVASKEAPMRRCQRQRRRVSSAPCKSWEDKTMDVRGRLAWAHGVAAMAWLLASGGAASADECKNRGQ